MKADRKRMHPRTFNWLILPAVVLVRMPIMLPLILVAKVGEIAESVASELGPHLPGFRYIRESKSRF